MRPPPSKPERTAVSVSAVNINSKRIVVCICTCYETHNEFENIFSPSVMPFRRPEKFQNNVGSVISPPKLPNIIPKRIRKRIRQSFAHTADQDQLIPETNRFGNHRPGITDNNSKIRKFGSVIILCVMVNWVF